MSILLLLTSSDFLVLSKDPHADFVPLRGPRSEWKHMHLWPRLKCAISLISNLRGIGWTHEPRKGTLPPPRPLVQPRKKRILLLVLRITRFFLLMLLNDVLIKLNPVFRFGSSGVRSSGVLWHVLGCTSAGLIVYAPFNVGHAIWELICVGLFRMDMDAPDEWRPLFGDLEDAWTVTRFWGFTWHQMMRRFLSAHGHFVAHCVLRLHPGSSLNRFIQILVAFCLSGIMHQTGEYMVAREHGRGWWNEGGGSFRFFMLQPIAIGLEDLVLGKRSFKLSSKKWRFVGYLWVLFWFSLTVPVWLNGAVRVGLMDQRVGLVFPQSFNVLPEGWDQYR
ncbi:hypothetical protein L218DRAFT_1076599 [Marasmius fiardii PR-910]|nr:hypothetical protein L218DRAFT_1076599 [Marasmius fiardii PR-910]